MANRNHVTADLRVSANAELKNSREFISKLDRIIDGFDFGDKMNNQLISAQEQLKNLNKILEKVQNKSVISDNELKELVKAGKEISDIVNKTEKLYSGFNSSDWKRYSKEYIAQVEAQQKEIAKIKEKYNKETGGNFDKDFANIDKYNQKLLDLSKNIEKLNNSKDEKIQNRIDEENKALQEQFEILQRVKKVEAERRIRKQEAINNYNENNNIKISDSKGKIKTDRADVTRELANVEYQKMVATFNEISKKRKEILDSGKNEKQTQKELVALAKQYNLQNVKNTKQFEEQFKALQEQKKFYNLLKNRDQLVDEKAITEEIERRLELAKQLADIDRDILTSNSFSSDKDLKSQKRKAENALDSTSVRVTDTGASLTQDAEDNIANEIVAATNKQTQDLNNELSATRSIVEQISQYAAKLATQSERENSQSDRNTTNRILEATEEVDDKVNNYTTEDNDRIANSIIKLGISSQIPYGKEIKEMALSVTDADDENFGQLSINLDEFDRFSDKLENAINEIKLGSKNVEEAREAAKNFGEVFDSIVEITLENFNRLEEDINNDLQTGKINEDTYVNKLEELHAKKDAFTRYYMTAGNRHNSIDNALNPSTKIDSEALGRIGEQTERASKGLQKAAEQTQYLGSAFDDIKSKIGYFLSLNYAFDLMVKKINEASSFVMNLDKDMTQIGLVLGQTASNTWKNFDTYAKMADRLNTTVSDVTGAMKLFYQQGLNTVEVNKMVEASAIAAALGESTMAEASETLTSIINGYNLSANQAMDVTDKISMVAMVSAADFGELSTAIEKVASSAASAGLDLDHMMGYLGKMIETTREAPTNIGTALKTIVANFTQFKEDPTGLMEEGTEINKVDTALKSVGISLTDTTGEVRDLSDVLDELGGKWSGLTRNQKSYLATQIAGTRQQSRFYALMNDYERTLELVGEAKNSEGKATQQFALYQDSLTAATTRLDNEWEKFYNKTLMSDQGLKTAKNGLTAILKIANKLGPVLSGLTIVGITKGARSLFIHFNKVKDTIEEINKKALSLGQISQNLLAGQDTFKNYSFTGKQNNFKATKGFNNIGNTVAESIFNKKGGQDQLVKLDNLKKIQEEMENWQERNEEFIKSQKELLDSVLGESEANEVVTGTINDAVKAKIADAVSTEADGVAHTVSAAAKWGEVAAQLALNLAITAAVAVVGLLVYAVMQGIAAEHEHTIALQEQAEKARQAYDELKELGNEYLELNKKVVKTIEEKERLEEVTEGLLEQYPELIAYIDSEGKAYAKTNAEIEKYIKQKEKDAIDSEANAARAILNDKSYKTNAIWTIANGIYKEDDKKMYGQNQQDKRDNLVNSLNNMRQVGVNTEIFYADNDARGLIELLQAEEYEKVNEWLNGAKEVANKEIKRINNLSDRNLKKEERERQVKSQEKRINAITQVEVASNQYQQAVKDELAGIAEKIYAQSIRDANLNDEKNSVATSILQQQTRKKSMEMSADKFKEYLSSQDYTNYQKEIIERVNNLSATTISQIEGYLKDINSDTTQTFSSIKQKVENLKKTAPDAADLLDDSLKEYEEIIKNIIGSETGNNADTKKTKLEGLRLSTLTNLGNAKDEMKGDKSEGYNEEEFNKIYNKILTNDNFLKELDNLDFSDLGAVNEFKQKYAKILGDYGVDFLNTLVKNPIYDAEKNAERLSGALQNSGNEGTTKSGASYSEIASGSSDEGAANILSSNDETRAQNIIMIGQKIKVSAEEISDSYRQAYEDVANSTNQIISQAETKINDHVQTIRQTLNNQDWNIGDGIDTSKLTDAEKEIIKNSKLAIHNLQQQTKNAKELQERYKSLTIEQKANVDYANFRNGVVAANEMINSLSNLASIYDVVTNKEYTQLDLINWIANDTSGQLLAALEVENGQLSLNAHSMEVLAEAKKQEALTAIDTEIRNTKAQIAYMEAHRIVTQEELDDIGKIDESERDLASNTSGYMSSMMKNWTDWARNIITNGTTIGRTISGLITMFNKLTQAEKDGSADSTNVVNGGATGANSTSDTSDSKALDRKQTLKTLNDKLTKLKALRTEVAGMSGKDILKGINGMGSYGGDKNGGSKDEFDPLLEKLEHFYNYLRKIEKLEAKINRLREERNLLDTSKNYYIDNLIEENKLLAEQQKLYTSYIADENEYLAELREGLTKKYSKWVSFDKEGVVQVKQTEFNLKTEKQKEEYEAFSELLSEYQDEYNTREENITKLTEAQVQQVENIAAAYEKVLERVTDVNDAIQKSIDLLEHDVTMSFSNIAKFDIFDEQAEKAVKGIREMFGFVNEYQAQIDKINKQVSEGALKEFFRWDEDLGYYRSNDLLLEDKDMQKKYEKMGYSWSEIHTYVKQTAKASEQLKQSWEESTDKANSFAETLKSLLENSISTFTDLVSSSGDELNKIFDTFDRKMNNIDNESNLFGVASENLEDKYVTLVTATATLKQTIGLLNDKRVAILDTIKEQYSEFVDEINGYTVINKQAIEESDKLTDGQKAQLLSWYEAFNAYDELVEASEDRLVDYFNQILEMENEKRDAIINLKQSVHDELIARDQEEIDDLKEKYDKMSQLDNEYYNKLADKVNRARQLREDRQADSAIPQTQAQIAVLKTDNSGTRNSEILNLQKQLNEQLQSQADRDVDRELERIQREQQEREEDRQLTIAAMENVLTFKDENNWYWQEAQRIWAEGPESVTGFLRTSNEYMNISDEQRAQLFEELSNSVNTAFATLQTAAGITSAISDGIVKDKSDEEQAKLDNVNNNLGFIQSQLGQEGLAGKIDWANAENAKHLLEIQTNADGNALKITTKLEDLYKEKIGPTAENLQNTVVQYLGKESDIWRKLGMLDATTGQVNTSVESGFTQLTDAVNKAITWISSDMDKAWSKYKTKAIEVFNYLSKEYGKQNAQTPDKNDVKLPDVKKEPTKNEPPKPTTPVKTDNSSGGTSKKTLKVGGGATAKTGAKIYSSYSGGSGAGQYYSKDPNYKVLQLRGNRALVRWHKLSSGYTGWFNKTDLTPYRKGGYVNYTGIAAVHGSKTSPEAFLSAKQTKLFEVLRDSLVATTNKGYTKEEKEVTNTGYNIDNINIEVKELADVDSVEKMTRKVKEEIYKDATGRNNMAVRRR